MREIRISLAIIVITLISVGCVMIYSSSGIYALQELGDRSYFLTRHLMFLTLGLIAMFAVMCLDYRDIQKYAKPLMVISLFLLVLVLIPGIGKSSWGARRWFKLGPLHFQPSELAKITILIYVADYLSRKKAKIHHFFDGILPILIVMGMFCLLIVKQPDLGNSVLIAVIVMMLAFIAGANMKHLLGMCLMSLPALYYLVAKVPWRMKRIMAFLDPWQDSQGVGFQLSQSQIALGSGGAFGVGLGKSVQKLFYLPAAHTDFILSIIGEELGLVGTLFVVFLFVAFMWQGARIAKRTMNSFGYYLSFGIVAIIGMQAVVNIGVSIGAFPTKGLPLPFVSYGGSALIFNLAAIGLLLNISRTEEL